MNRRTLSLTVAAAAVLSGPALAQEGGIDLGTIVVSGALTPQPANRTGASVDVVGTAELATAPATAGQTLARLPGVNYTANGGTGASSFVQIRGLPGKYTGVRIDGIDVSDPAGVQFQFDFGALPLPSALGRIEVVRGSQSALFGSEAVGGVIDIATADRDRLGFGIEAQAEAGSFGTTSGAISISQRTEAFGLSFGLARTTGDGFSARAADTENDAFDLWMATLSGDVALGDDVVLGFSLLRLDAETDFDRSDIDAGGTLTSEQTGARVFAEIDAFGIAHEFALSRFEIARRDPGGFITAFDGDRDEASYLGTTEIGRTTLSFGLEYSEESFTTDTDTGSSSRTSAFAEAILRPTDDLDVAISARYDDDADFGGQTSARIAAAWQAGPNTTLRGLVATGYRAPSLFERFSAFGDPGLTPETSLSYELGVEQRYAGGAVIEATAFRTEIEDLIDFDGAAAACGSGFGCYAQVPGTTVTQGIEIAGEVPVAEGYTLFGSYTYTDAQTDGVRLARVPRHDARIGLDAQVTERLAARLDVQMVADVEPSPFAPAGNKVGDYTLANLGLSYRVSDMAEAYLRVENLFDEDYEVSGGFNTPGQAIYVGIRAAF